MKKNRKNWRFLILAACALVLLAFSACADTDDQSSLISEPEMDPSLFVEGTSLSTQNISGKTVDQALEIGREILGGIMEELEISVKFKDDTVLLKDSDFEYQEVLELSLPKLLESRAPGEYDIQYVVDLSQEGKDKLNTAAESCYVSGKNATVSGYDWDTESFIFTDATTGTRVDMNQTLKNVRQLLSQKHGGALQAKFIEVQPTLTKEELSENFKRISTYSTISTNTENGNSNMKLAMSRINGTVLEPGQIFSYNDTIGNSTSTDDGWLPAGGLSGGVLVQMIGGGICQGSSTLYGSILRAGLEIVYRDCHAVESSYCPTGLDATVDYGNIDFQFKNNMDTPIYIMSGMDGTTVYASIYGVFPEEWDSIEVYSERVATYSPLDTVTFREDSSLGYGEYKLFASGNSGVESIASRSFYKNGEFVRTEELPSSYYRPTGKIYRYGPGTDTSAIDTTAGSGSTNSKPSATPAPTPKPESPPADPPTTPTPTEPEVIPTPTPETPVDPVDTSTPE